MKKITLANFSSTIFKGFMYFIMVFFPLIFSITLGILLNITESKIFLIVAIAFWMFFIWWFDSEAKKFDWHNWK